MLLLERGTVVSSIGFDGVISVDVVMTTADVVMTTADVVMTVVVVGGGGDELVKVVVTTEGQNDGQSNL